MFNEIHLVYAFIDPFTLTAVIGVATSAAGLFSSKKEAKRQKAANQEFQRQTNAISSAINDKLSGQDSLFNSLNSATQQRDDLTSAKDQELVALRRQAEKLQYQESLADYRRSTRQNIRDSIVARAAVEVNAGNQDVLGSSGVAGGLASVATQTATGQRFINEKEDLTTNLFNLGEESFNTSNRFNDLIGGQNRAISGVTSQINQSNRDISRLQTSLSQVQANQQGSNQASQVRQQENNALFSTGVSLVQNAGTFSDVFKTTFPKG